LLTGRHAYQAGNRGLSKAVTLAEVLREAGYFTAMTGKWHLSKEPTEFGFQRYFGHLSGSCNYFTGDETFRLNGQPWTVPREGFYTTVANVDYALRFLDEARQTGKPWFLYVAFNAPHNPLQPLEQDYRKYLGRYDEGWDKTRAARARRQNELGLFGKTLEPSPRPEHLPAWESMSADRKTFESHRMAAYAALVHRLDAEVGRLIADLKRTDELNNTLILFVSDNGGCPFDGSRVDPEGEPFRAKTQWRATTGWAWVSNTPFRFYKQNQYEGGISSPAIVHWPAGLKTSPGAIVHEPAHLVDVLPTIAEVTGASLPDAWPGRELAPLA
jgi:arylsulfatase